MPALVIPNTFQVSVHGLSHGNEVVNVFSYYRVGGINATEAQQIAISWRDTNLANLLACLNNSYAAQKIVVKNLHIAGGPVYELALVGPYPGARGGDASPGNVALALSWRTSSATRSGRGRSYLGPIAETDTIGDTVISALLSLIAVFANTMVTSPPIIGSNLAVASRKFLITRVVASFVVDYILDSMRRRLTGRGR